MKYAVIRSGGRQYRVAEGEELVLDKLPEKVGQEVAFEVLLLADGEAVKVGRPVLGQVQVLAEVLGQEKGEKIRVAKFRAKSRYRRVSGHRQSLTRVKIKKIAVKSRVAKPTTKKSPKTK